MRLKEYVKGYVPDKLETSDRLQFIHSKIMDMLRNESRKKILDVGSGDGNLAKLLSKNHDVLCLEVNKTRIEQSKSRGLKVVEQDAEKIWKIQDNSFDIVIMSELIEHCFDTKHLISESYRVLKSGGKVLITTPNICSLGHRIQILFGRQPSFYSPASIDHIRFFSPSTMKKLLKEKGFRIVSSKTVTGFGVLNFGNVIIVIGEKI